MSLFLRIPRGRTGIERRPSGVTSLFLEDAEVQLILAIGMCSLKRTQNCSLPRPVVRKRHNRRLLYDSAKNPVPSKATRTKRWCKGVEWPKFTKSSQSALTLPVVTWRCGSGCFLQYLWITFETSRFLRNIPHRSYAMLRIFFIFQINRARYILKSKENLWSGFCVVGHHGSAIVEAYLTPFEPLSICSSKICCLSTAKLQENFWRSLRTLRNFCGSRKTRRVRHSSRFVARFYKKYWKISNYFSSNFFLVKHEHGLVLCPRPRFWAPDLCTCVQSIQALLN